MDWQEDEILGKAYDAAIMSRLRTYVKPYLGLLMLSASLLLVFSFLDLVPADLIKRAVDGPVKSYIDAEIDRDSFLWGLTELAFVFGGVVLLGFFVRGAHMWVVEYLGQRVMVDIRREVFRKIQRLSLGFFDRNPVGRLVTRVVSDVESLYQALSMGIVSIFGDLVKIAAIVALMLSINWQLALWLTALLPLMFGVSLRFRNKARQGYRNVRREIARTNANVQESITGMRVVQIFSREKRARKKFEHLSDKLYRAHAGTIFHFAWFFPTVELFFAMAQGMLIFLSAKYVLKAELTTGEFFQFWLYLGLIFEPIRNLSEQYNVMQSAMASSERIFRILDTEELVPNPAVPIRTDEETFRGEIEFDHVWFAYRGEEWVLKDVSFKVPAGTSVALVGATGAGKTSIISLISRLYDIQRGRILLDGRDIREYDKYELRSRISVVLQDVFLFAGDVTENIRLGREEIPEERVVAAARAVGADGFISRLPAGYRAPVLERGATLSVGQKQLLAFARALAFDPSVLILDEATSSIDTETEALIQQALEKLMTGRTSLIIAHRLSTIRSCDRILVLHHGEVRERGTHQELVAKRGIYRRLYELQAL
jgi:ATP-binding cassette, subfamily B, multidrug efflux pump